MRSLKSLVIIITAIAVDSAATAQLLVPSIAPGECEPCYTATVPPKPCYTPVACGVVCWPWSKPRPPTRAPPPVLTTTLTTFIPYPHPSCPYTSTVRLPELPCAPTGGCCGAVDLPIPDLTVTRTSYTSLWCNGGPALTTPTPSVRPPRPTTTSCSAYKTVYHPWMCPMIICARKEGCVVPLPEPVPAPTPVPAPVVAVVKKEEAAARPPPPLWPTDGPRYTLAGCTVVVMGPPCPPTHCEPCAVPVTM